MTSTSFEALRDWLDGERAYQGLLHDSAAVSFASALEHDSTFALAAYRLGQSYGWFGQLEASRVAFEAATRFADRLSERDRLMLEGMKAFLDGDVDRASRAYRRVIAVHPDDREAWFWLGDALIHFNPPRGRPQEEAREPLMRALTGRATDENVQKARTHKINGFVTKPPTIDMLRIQIRDVLGL